MENTSTAPAKRRASDAGAHGCPTKRLRSDGDPTPLARHSLSSTPSTSDVARSSAATSPDLAIPGISPRAPVTRTVHVAVKAEADSPAVPRRRAADDVIDLTTDSEGEDPEYAALYGKSPPPVRLKVEQVVKAEPFGAVAVKAEPAADEKTFRAALLERLASSGEPRLQSLPLVDEEDEDEDWAFSGTPAPSVSIEKDVDDVTGQSLMSPPPTPVHADDPAPTSVPLPNVQPNVQPVDGADIIATTLSAKSDTVTNGAAGASTTILAAGLTFNPLPDANASAAFLPVGLTPEAAPVANALADASAAYLPGDLTPEAAPVVSALDGAGCARLPLHVSPPDSSATSTALLDGTTAPDDVDDDWLALVAPPDFVPEPEWVPPPSPSPPPPAAALPFAESDLSEDDDQRDVAPGFVVRARAPDDPERVQCAACGRWLRRFMTPDHVARQCGRVLPEGKVARARGRGQFVGRKRRKTGAATEAARLAKVQRRDSAPGAFSASASASAARVSTPTASTSAPRLSATPRRLARSVSAVAVPLAVEDDPWVAQVAPDRGAVRCAACGAWVAAGIKWSGRTGHKSTCAPIVEDARQKEDEQRLRELAHLDEAPAEVPAALWTDARVRRIDGDQAQCDECGIWTLFKNWDAHHERRCTLLKSRKMRAAAGLGSEDLGDLSDLTSQSEGELGAARYVDDAEEPQSPDAQPQSAPPEAGPSETRLLRAERRVMMQHDPAVGVLSDDADMLQCRCCTWRSFVSGMQDWWDHRSGCRECKGVTPVDVTLPPPCRMRRIKGDRVQCNGCGKWMSCPSWEKHVTTRCTVFAIARPLTPSGSAPEPDAFETWLAAQPVDDVNNQPVTDSSLVEAIATRKAELLQDPAVRALGHNQVLCRLCGVWVKTDVHMNPTHKWYGHGGHRVRCVARHPAWDDDSTASAPAAGTSPLVISIRSPAKPARVASSDPILDAQSSDASDWDRGDDDDFRPEHERSSSEEPELDI